MACPARTDSGDHREADPTGRKGLDGDRSIALPRQSGDRPTRRGAVDRHRRRRDRERVISCGSIMLSRSSESVADLAHIPENNLLGDPTSQEDIQSVEQLGLLTFVFHQAKPFLIVPIEICPSLFSSCFKSISRTTPRKGCLSIGSN